MSDLIAMGADHAGYTLKEALKAELIQQRRTHHDYGCMSETPCDYPSIAYTVAQAVDRGEARFGILCCGSGVGMAMAANRFPHVRAVVCHDLLTAQMSRRHNNANVICFGGRVVAPEYAMELLDAFLNTPFDEGRHQARVCQLSQIGDHSEAVSCEG